MARAKKTKKSQSNDPRSNYGKYSSDSAPRKSNTSGVSKNSTEREAGKPNTQAADDAKPTEPQSSKANEAEASKPANARGINDPEWYTKDTQVVIDAASIPFSEPIGDEMKLLDPGIVLDSNGVVPYHVAAMTQRGASMPGILTAKSKSTFGNARYATDPANVAANALYSHVRYVNSGRKNYDPSDLFMYVSSMADIYSYVMWCERIYAKAFLYSQRNKYIGEGLLKSEFIDPNDLKLNLANFRYWLNTYINKVSSFAVPSAISYYQRRAWIYAHIYLENPDANVKDQMYQFTPDGFYRFALDSSGAGMLEYKIIGNIINKTVNINNLMTTSDLITIGEWLMANVVGDEDFGLMSGDILKAFNGDIIGIPSLPEVVDIVPVYSEYVLLQIKNATVIDVSRDTLNPCHYDDLASGVACYTGNVYQNSDGNIWAMEGIKSDGNHTPACVAASAKKVFTVNTPSPTPVDVMEISRLTIGGYGILALTGMDPVVKISCGADIITAVYTFKYSWNVNVWEFAYDAVVPVSFNTHAYWNNTVEHYAKFKYAPMLIGYSEDTAPTPAEIYDMRVISELDNYTIVDWRIIARLHEVALLSMLWVPGVAKLVNLGKEN